MRRNKHTLFELFINYIEFYAYANQINYNMHNKISDVIYPFFTIKNYSNFVFFYMRCFVDNTGAKLTTGDLHWLVYKHTKLGTGIESDYVLFTNLSRGDTIHQNKQQNKTPKTQNKQFIP